MCFKKTGISTCVFDNFELVDCIECMGNSSIKLLEWSDNFFSHLVDETYFKQIRQLLKQTGVKINSIHVPFWIKESDIIPSDFFKMQGPQTVDISHPDNEIRKQAIRGALFCLERLKQLNGSYLVIHLSGELNPDIDRQAHLERALDSLQIIKKELPQDGSIKIAIENLPRWCLGNESSELLWLLEKLDSDKFGICLDVNHCFKESLELMTEKLDDKIITLHISDTDGVDERHWLPGRGILNWAKWTQIMTQINNSAPFIYELNPDWNGEGKLPESPQQVINVIKNNTAKFNFKA